MDINPVNIVKYAVANKIGHEPDFALWLSFSLRKRNMIVSKIQNKYWHTTQKIDIKVPTLMNWEYGIDDKTVTGFWMKSINK